jgi:hypothetical protein
MTTIIKRIDKGAPLTHVEMDQNLENLRTGLDEHTELTGTSVHGLGTAAKMPILGTTTQSSGVPTGSIIERGSNANGYYVKFADGTIHCYGASVANVFASSSIIYVDVVLPANIVANVVNTSFHDRHLSITRTGIERLDIAVLPAHVLSAGTLSYLCRIGFRSNNAFVSTDTISFTYKLTGRWF